MLEPLAAGSDNEPRVWWPGPGVSIFIYAVTTGVGAALYRWRVLWARAGGRAHRILTLTLQVTERGRNGPASFREAIHTTESSK